MKKLLITTILASTLLSGCASEQPKQSLTYNQQKAIEQVEVKKEINQQMKQLVKKYNDKGYAIEYSEIK